MRRSRPGASKPALSLVIVGPIGCIATLDSSSDAGVIVPASVAMVVVSEPTQWLTQCRSWRPVAVRT